MSGGSSQSVQKAEPWSGQQPYLNEVFQSAQNIYQNNPSQFYPGKTYLPFNALQQRGIDEQLSGIPQMQGVANQAGQTFSNLANASDIRNNPVANNWQRAMQNQLQSNVGGSINQLARGFSNQEGQLNRAYDSLADQQRRAFAAQSGQQFRNYDALSGRTFDDLENLRERQLRDYGVSKNLLTEDLTRNILPGISMDAVGAGQSGSSRQGIAEGIAATNAQNRLAELARTQDETLASQLRSSGLTFGDTSRSISENFGDIGREQAGQLGDFGRASVENLGSAVRENYGRMGDVTRDLTTGANANLANFYGTQYGQGLDSARSAMAFAPQLQQLYGMPGQYLSGIGDRVSQQQYLPLQESMDRYRTNLQAPWDDLSRYSGLITGLPSGLGTTTTDQPKDRLGGAAGGAMMGTAIMPGWGTLAGGVLGAMMA